MFYAVIFVSLNLTSILLLPNLAEFREFLCGRFRVQISMCDPKSGKIFEIEVLRDAI